MAEGRNRVAGIMMPALLAGAVVLLGWWLFKPKAPPPAQPGSEKTAAVSPTGPGAGAPTAGALAPGFTGPLSTRMQAPLDPGALAVLGGLDAGGSAGPLMRLGFNQSCAGVLELALARHFQGVEPGSPHEVLQQTQEHDGKSLVPFALLEVTINDQSVKLAGVYLDGAGKPAGYDWKQAAPGVFVAEIMDATGKDVARVSRTFRLVQGLYEFTVETAFENLTAVPMTVRFTETGPVELPIGVIRYGGDPRRARFGLVSGSDTQDVSGRTPLMRRDQMLGSMPGGSWGPLTVWPTEQTAPHGEALSWFGLTNRFFAVTVHALPSPEPAHTGAPAPNADKRLTGVAQIDRIVLARGPDKKGQFEANAAGALRTLSPVVAVPGGGAHRVSVGVYAGPIDREPLASADKADGRIGLTDLEIYFWPGPCSFCTFQPVAYFLRWVLSIFADYVVFDWALAIILLVVCVRTALHPVTKWSQISLQRFGKQMQKVAPKQKVLQEKFKDDPARLRQEMAALMREENVNYAGMLGCLPMFLQTPVWIALSSMMFFLFDLRHTPAFFGVIQKLTGGNWQFLADLAEPDRFIRLPFSFNVPLMNEIDSVNILPVVLGTVFFIQQKYMTPPPTAQLSPEMEMQQKIMKVLIVFMFPIMMYNAPSGLALYFITNSTLGILESRHIRRAFEKQEAQREELRKRNPHAFDKRAEPGFIARFQARIAEAQARAEQVKAQHSRHGPRKPGE